MTSYVSIRAVAAHQNPYVHGDWKNIGRTKYNPVNFIAAALQINEGSHAPDWSAGPQWAIFDSEAVKRERIRITENSVDPQYFFKADTIEELAEKINTNPWMSHKIDPKVLAETVRTYNTYVDKGEARAPVQDREGPLLRGRDVGDAPRLLLRPARHERLRSPRLGRQRHRRALRRR